MNARVLPLRPRSGRGTGFPLPPPTLPAAHFAAGTFWLIAGAIGIVITAPQLTDGAFLHPRVIAVTHAFTLGVVTTSIFGALYQIFPVALGVSARSVPIAHWTGLLLQCGTIALIVGSWFWIPWMLAAGWMLILVAVGAISWNLLPQRRKSERGRAIGLYVSAGHAGLGFAMIVAAVLIGEKLQWYRVDRLGLLAAHMHLAALGFATMTIAGVGTKLLPMFLQSRNQIEWPICYIGPVLGAGLCVFSIGSIAALPIWTMIGAFATSAAVLIQVVWMADCFRTRGVRKMSAGPALIAAAALMVVAAAALGLTMLFLPGINARVSVGYGILGIVGWLTLFVVGVWYKILPVLVWTHRFAPIVGTGAAPTIGELSWPAVSWASAALLATGVALLALGATSGAIAMVKSAAALFLAGALLVATHHVRLVMFHGSEPRRLQNENAG